MNLEEAVAQSILNRMYSENYFIKKQYIVFIGFSAAAAFFNLSVC